MKKHTIQSMNEAINPEAVKEQSSLTEAVKVIGMFTQMKKGNDWYSVELKKDGEKFEIMDTNDKKVKAIVAFKDRKTIVHEFPTPSGTLTDKDARKIRKLGFGVSTTKQESYEEPGRSRQRNNPHGYEGDM